jgi:UDP-GlcNAc:undecaprenyl-phosphate GlcNAc-1-phosphate transferase
MTALLAPILGAAVLLASSSKPYQAQIGATGRALLRPLGDEPSSLLRYGLSHRALELAGIMAGAVGMLIVGLVDDQKELRPGAKFIGQFLIALLVATSGARITLFVPFPWFHYAVTILWILTVVNAFNFIDNMNGLCTGLGLIGAWHFAMLAASGGQYLVALIAFLTCGALLGFLPYNFPTARAFLGDAGSHLVGYLLAVLAILPHFYNPRHLQRWAVLIPLLVLAVPLLDLVRVVLLRWRMGRPFYVGDNNHLSHRLVTLGLTRTRAVLVLWFLAAVIGSLSYFC